MEYNRAYIPESEAVDLYNKAYTKILDEAFHSGEAIKYRQLKIMKWLSKNLTDLVFCEV